MPSFASEMAIPARAVGIGAFAVHKPIPPLPAGSNASFTFRKCRSTGFVMTGVSALATGVATKKQLTAASPSHSRTQPRPRYITRLMGVFLPRVMNLLLSRQEYFSLFSTTRPDSQAEHFFQYCPALKYQQKPKPLLLRSLQILRELYVFLCGWVVGTQEFAGALLGSVGDLPRFSNLVLMG